MPILVEYLADKSPTKLSRTNPYYSLYEQEIYVGPKRPNMVLRFNEVIAWLISYVAHYTYSQYRPLSPIEVERYGIESSKGMMNFKAAALDWYAVNRNIPPEDRQIEGLRDPELRSYSEVLSWLADNQTQKAVQPINRFIDDLISGQLKSTQSEHNVMMAARTLGIIGDKGGLRGTIAATRWEAELFRDGYYNSQDRIVRIFWMFEARIKVGDRMNSLSELERLYDDCAPKMRAAYRDFFVKQMLKIRRGLPIRWEPTLIEL